MEAMIRVTDWLIVIDSSGQRVTITNLINGTSHAKYLTYTEIGILTYCIYCGDDSLPAIYKEAVQILSRYPSECRCIS